MKVALTEVAGIIAGSATDLARGKATIDGVVTRLGGLSAQYGAVGTAIEEALQADPGNAIYEAMAADWAALVENFTAVQAMADAQKAAIEAL